MTSVQLNRIQQRNTVALEPEYLDHPLMSLVPSQKISNTFHNSASVLQNNVHILIQWDGELFVEQDPAQRTLSKQQGSINDVESTWIIILILQSISLHFPGNLNRMSSCFLRSLRYSLSFRYRMLANSVALLRDAS